MAAVVPFSMVPASMAKVLWRRLAFVPLGDLRQRDSEACRDLAHHAAPGHGQHARRKEERHVVERAPETHDVEEDHGLVVGVVVEHLGATYLLNALRDPAQHERQRVVGEAGVHPVDEEGDARLLRRRDHRRRQRVVRCRVLEHDRAGGDDVDTGGQEPLQVGQGFEDAVVGHGGVDDAVRLQGQQRVDVVRPGHPHGVTQPGQLTGIAPDLVRIGDEEADQLELGMGVDAGEGVSAHIAGAPLHDAVRHRVLLRASWLRGRGSASRGWATAGRRQPRGSCRSRRTRPASRGRG